MTMTFSETPTRLFDIINMRYNKKTRRPCFYYRDRSVFADDYRRQVDLISYSLLARGLQRGEPVALISENRPEWNVVDMAVMQAGGVLQPLCKGLSAEEYLECLCMSKVRTIFLEDSVLYGRFKLLLPQIPTIENIVTFDPAGGCLSYVSLLEEGALHEDANRLERRRNLVSTDDVCVLTYTGGGTYNCLTHKCLLEGILEQATSESCRRQAAAGTNALCTLYGRTKNYVCQLVGRTVNYPSSYATEAA